MTWEPRNKTDDDEAKLSDDEDDEKEPGDKEDDDIKKDDKDPDATSEYPQIFPLLSSVISGFSIPNKRQGKINDVIFHGNATPILFSFYFVSQECSRRSDR